MSKLPLDLDAVKADLGLAELDGPQERAYYDRLMFHPTLTINGLHGGYGGAGLEDGAAVRGLRQMRHPPRRAADAGRRAARRYGSCANATRRTWSSFRAPAMLPSKTPMDNALRRRHPAGDRGRARRRAAALSEQWAAACRTMSFTKILGVPAFVVPYANADEANHAPNENLKLDRFIDGIRTGAALLWEIGKLDR